MTELGITFCRDCSHWVLLKVNGDMPLGDTRFCEREIRAGMQHGSTCIPRRPDDYCSFAVPKKGVDK